MNKISKTFKINKPREIYIPNEADKVIHKKINNELRSKYNITLTDRDTIIRSLISILTQGNYNESIIPDIDFTIIRSDIKNFYPSINKHKLFQKISQSNILKKESLDILKPMFFNKRMVGVPLGFSFSSSLSEIYLEEFDEQIDYKFNPVFYFRYVDDIILIINVDENKNRTFYNKTLKEIAKNNDLNINWEKSSVVNWMKQVNEPFNYLGYSFTKDGNQLIIDISDEKYLKVKKRISGYFYDFNNSAMGKEDFWILYYRLINRIYGTTSDTEKNLKYGLGFSYKHINSEYQLINLFNFIAYNIRQLKITSFQQNTLFSLIRINKNKNSKQLMEENITDILKRRINYNRLTHNQLNKMCNQLNISFQKNSSKSYKVKYIFRTLK